MRDIAIKPISTLLLRVQTDLEETIKHLKDNAVETRKRVETNFQAVALLDAAGFDFQLPEWSSMTNVTLDLGQRPTGKRASAAFVGRLREIREILGSPLKLHYKNAVGRKRLVKLTLRAADYPGLSIEYVERIPAGAKCKIVRTKTVYKNVSLVCEA